MLVATASFTLAGLAASPAQAQINGFGDGSSFTLNTNGSGTPSISGGTFQATTSVGFEASSVYYNTKQNITDWTADFTYQDVNGYGADGVTFVLQNYGLTALGGNGGGLGYAYIPSSAALAFNIYSGTGSSGVNFLTDGLGYGVYGGTGTVNLDLPTPVDVHVSYDGANLTETLTQGSNVFSQSYTADLSSILGSDTAYVGFTGGDGGESSTQNISNFQFSPAPVPEASTVVSLGVLLGLGGLAMAVRRRRTAASQ